MGSRTGPRLVRRGGIWYCWVPKPGGGTRRVTTNCTDRKAAEAKARELERGAADPAHQASYTTTVQQACDRFLASRKRAGRAAGTLHHYGVKLSHLATKLRMPLAMLTMASVERYIDEREQEGARRTTIKKELRALQVTLRHARRQGLWLGEVDRVVPEYADDYKPRTRALSFDEARDLIAVLAFADNSQPIERARNRAAMVAFILATGARWGEACRARREDVVGEFVHLRGTKTKAAARTVPIVKLTRGLLDFVLVHANAEGRLFDRWSNPGRDLSVACAQAKMAPCSPNDLRRSVTTWLRASGVDLSIIAAFLGHTTSRMVERVYGRLSPEDLRVRMGGGHVDRTRGKKGAPKLLPATTDSKERP